MAVAQAQVSNKFLNYFCTKGLSYRRLASDARATRESNDGLRDVNASWSRFTPLTEWDTSQAKRRCSFTRCTSDNTTSPSINDRCEHRHVLPERIEMELTRRTRSWIFAFAYSAWRCR